MKKQKPVGKIEMNIFAINTLKRVIKSVPKPTAQSPALCVGRENKVSEIIANCYKIISNKNEPLELRLFLELQMLSGARVSELLNIKTSDILSDNSIFVGGLKGSDDRLIHSINFNNYISRIKITPPHLLFQYNRWFIYRWYKKKGISLIFPSHHNHSVTHFFRHYIILMRQNEGINIENNKKFIGHKSVKSTKIYANEKG